MRILITGAHGQLGASLQNVLLSHELIACGHGDLDITSGEQVEGALTRYRPDMVINTAAYHKVDECESYPDKTFLVNALGPRLLAQFCQRAGVALTHVSTNFVFDGTQSRPYTEEDPPGPVNVYGTAKLAGEYLVRALCARHFIIRTTGLYGFAGGGGGKGYNFIELMIRLGRERGKVTVVEDQIISPTHTTDLAQAIARLIETERYGVYHITNSGRCSYFEFARTIYEKTGIDATVSPITTQSYGATARRPLYTVLDNSRLAGVGVPTLRAWQTALDDYLAQRRNTE